VTQPFRFGVQLSELPMGDWPAMVRRIEELGYSTLFVPDHFGSQWDPVAFCAAAAAVTERLNVGTLVCDVDYRHPVIHAKAAATTQLLSGGRFEFGLGAGWMESDYVSAGIAYDPPGVRIGRLDEALQICRSMWTEERTSFSGEHYTVTDVPRAVELGDVAPPKVIVGGGGRRVLRLAGRYADVVGINPSLHEGRITPASAADLTPQRLAEKISWVTEGAAGAGRDPDTIELQSLVVVAAVVDDPAPMIQGLAGGTGMSEEEVAGCPLFLLGSAAQICESLQARRDTSGISYIVTQPHGGIPEMEAFAEAVVAPLSGK